MGIFIRMICIFFLSFSLGSASAQVRETTTYASNPTERAQNYESHFARRKSIGLDSLYRQVAAETNPWIEIRRRFTYKQLDEYNLVDIVAYFWMHSHGVNTNLMPSGISEQNYDFKWSHDTWRAVRDQVRTTIEKTNALKDVNNSGRQRIADTLMLETVFQQQALIKARAKGNDDGKTRIGFQMLNDELIGFALSKAELGTGGFYAPAGSNLKLPFDHDARPTAARAGNGAGSPVAAAAVTVVMPPIDKTMPKVIGLFYSSEWRQIIGAAPYLNSSYTEETSIVIFSDGTACENCHTSWAQGAVSFANFKRNNPAKFGTWKTSTTGTTVLMDGRITQFNRTDQFQPGRSGQHFNATVTTVSGPSNSGGRWNTTSYFRFHPDGRFSLINDPAQRQTLMNFLGRYTISGDFRIRLDYDDGAIELHSFAVSPTDSSFFVIDGTAHYVSKR